MKILPAQPIQFTTGDILDPGDLVSLYEYSTDAVADVASKRWQDSFLVLPCVEDCSTSYTNSSSAEELTYRFTCPQTCIVRGCYFNASMTSAAEVQVNLVASVAGTPPAGATVPLMTTGGAVSSATVDTADTNLDRILLTAGAEYKFIISSTGVFNLQRCDIVLHIQTDRWNNSGTPTIPNFVPSLYSDASFADGYTVVANNAALTTEIARFGSNLAAPVPFLIVKHNFLSGTSANTRTFQIPRFNNTRAQSRIVRIYQWAVMDGTASSTVTGLLRDSSAATLVTMTCNVSGVTFASADSGLINFSLTSSTAGISATTSLDYSYIFSNSSASVNCRKAYALVWISR